MNIHLHIDELVLEGLPPNATDADTVKAAVAAELARMFAGGDLAPGLRHGGARPPVATDDIHLGKDGNATDLGRRIGQTLYRGINR